MEDTRHDESSEFKVKDRRFWNLSEDEKEAVDEQKKQAAEDATQVLQFQAETKQLLDLFIHSLYSNKEIFLRELISNASDALDRLRFEAVTRPDLQGDDELEIRLEADANARTLTIHDNGIGMSREELISNIGTIAKSGTQELLAKLKEKPSSEETIQLIGQFGVGFYSAFMVAEKVSLVTRRAGEQSATLWESNGDGTYTIGQVVKPNRGTSITLHLKSTDAEDGQEDFTDEWVLSRIVKKYSDFVRYPIRMKVEREELEKDEEGKPTEDGKKTTVVEDKTLNSTKAIWLRRPQEVKEEEYHDFYKHISHDWEKPLKVITLNAEGRLEYQALLFIPSQAPFDLFYQGSDSGLQLYAKNVKILEKCEDLLPHYLRFIKGVVDSSDISLNVSRELLQQDRQITQIRNGLIKKVLDTLTDLQNQEIESYLTFWKHFGRTIKEGVYSDIKNKEKLLPLLMFESSADAEKLTTLKEYVDRMKEGQEKIYYLTGESRSVVENSPHLEAFKAKGYEVLYFVDPVDELMAQTLTEFDGKQLQSVGKGTVELGTKEEREEAEKKRKEKEEGLKGLLELLQKKLDEHVKEVRLSTRLTSSPVCLVGSQHDYSPQLERLLQKTKAGGGPKQRRIMELNPEHPILQIMRKRFDADKEDSVLGDFAELLFGQALLAEGSEVPDPTKFCRLVADIMVRASQN